MEIIDRGIRLFSGPDFTADTLRALQMAVEDVRTLKATPHQAAAKVRRKSPRAARELREWLNTGIMFASLMLAIAIAYAEWRSKDRTNVSDQQVIEEAVEDYLDGYLLKPSEPGNKDRMDQRKDQPTQYET